MLTEVAGLLMDEWTEYGPGRVLAETGFSLTDPRADPEQDQGAVGGAVRDMAIGAKPRLPLSRGDW